jgi:hypothetical protein
MMMRLNNKQRNALPMTKPRTWMMMRLNSKQRNVLPMTKTMFFAARNYGGTLVKAVTGRQALAVFLGTNMIGQIVLTILVIMVTFNHTTTLILLVVTAAVMPTTAIEAIPMVGMAIPIPIVSIPTMKTSTKFHTILLATLIPINNILNAELMSHLINIFKKPEGQADVQIEPMMSMITTGKEKLSSIQQHPSTQLFASSRRRW